MFKSKLSASVTKRFNLRKPWLSLSAGLLVCSCATAPFRDEPKIDLQAAILQAATALDGAGKKVREEHLEVYGLRPARATVSLDLSIVQGKGNNATLNVSAPVSAGTAGFGLGWSATRQFTTGNHIEIVFTPNGK